MLSKAEDRLAVLPQDDQAAFDFGQLNKGTIQSPGACFDSSEGLPLRLHGGAKPKLLTKFIGWAKKRRGFKASLELTRHPTQQDIRDLGDDKQPAPTVYVEQQAPTIQDPFTAAHARAKDRERGAAPGSGSLAYTVGNSSVHIPRFGQNTPLEESTPRFPRPARDAAGASDHSTVSLPHLAQTASSSAGLDSVHSANSSSEPLLSATSPSALSLPPPSSLILPPAHRIAANASVSTPNIPTPATFGSTPPLTPSQGTSTPPLQRSYSDTPATSLPSRDSTDTFIPLMAALASTPTQTITASPSASTPQQDSPSLRFLHESSPEPQSPAQMPPSGRQNSQPTTPTAVPLDSLSECGESPPFEGSDSPQAGPSNRYPRPPRPTNGPWEINGEDPFITSAIGFR